MPGPLVSTINPLTDIAGHITIHYLAALHTQTKPLVMCLRTQTHSSKIIFYEETAEETNDNNSSISKQANMRKADSDAGFQEPQAP